MSKTPLYADPVVVLLFLGLAFIFIATVIIFVYWIRRRNRERFSAYKDATTYMDDYLNEREPLYVKQEKKRQVELTDLENAIMCARFALRTLPYTLSRPLFRTGSRLGKWYFLLRSNTNKNRDKFIMTLVRPSPKDCRITNLMSSPAQRDKFAALLQSITSARHPFIFPTSSVEFLLDKGFIVIVRPFKQKGCLRDLLHQSDPLLEFEDKYSRPGKALPEFKVAEYGRQILEGLSVLKKSGVTYRHLSTANVAVDHGVCRLSEYENDYLGYKPYHTHLTDDVLARHPGASVSVLSFGCVLYEMAIGDEMDSAIELRLVRPQRCPGDVYKILLSIFASKKAPPSLQDLLANPFFAGVRMRHTYDNPKLPLDIGSKEFLKSIRRSMAAKRKKKKKASTRVSTSAQRSGPPSSNGNETTNASAAPNAPTPPPPPPPSAVTKAPKSQQGRGALLDAIRSSSPDMLNSGE
eukprot:TRINITY_DN3661_c1_g1_i1.p1 TRINITY_DN3661_c1_g1~~TRINITY_DN3661_c1_g1_i1.p1  ORF type:complete len:465 (+),score=79.08 TRINITY_DN3661_c1_g1_i1:408-1802(+)